MSLPIYTLSDSGEKQVVACEGNLFIELGNGTSLELFLEEAGNSPSQNALAIFSRITGKENGEAEHDQQFSSLSIYPGAANVISVSAKIHRKKDN